MAKFGLIGALVGTGLAVAAAPFTGGASLAAVAPIWAAGAVTGSLIGSQIDATKADKRSKKIANEQLDVTRTQREMLRSEKDKVDAATRRERSKIDAGIARSLRRKYKKPEGFLKSNADQGSGVLG